MDIVYLQRVLDEENVQEDYELNSSFPTEAPSH